MGIQSCIVQYYIWIRGLLLWPVYELYIIEWFSHSLPLVEAYLIHPVAAGFSFMMVVTLASEGFLSKYYIQMAIHKQTIKFINLWTMLMQFKKKYLYLLFDIIHECRDIEKKGVSFLNHRKIIVLYMKSAYYLSACVCIQL